MSAAACITWLQWILGMIALVVLIPNVMLPPASKNVDHPSRYWRIFFRIMVVLTSNLFSWWVTFIGLILVFGDLDTGDMAESTRALLALTVPLPLLVPFYWLIVKAARKAERDRLRS